MKKVRMIVSGRVQGVAFRMYTQHEARSLGLTGYVRNLYNGDAEIVAEGEDDVVDMLIAWAYKGPPGARVDDVQLAVLEPGGDYKDFSIRY